MDAEGDTTARPPAVDADALDDAVRELLRGCLLLPGTRRAGLALTEGGGRRLRFTATDRIGPDEALDWCLIDAYDDVPLTAAVATGRPVVGALDDLHARFASLVAAQREQGVVALAALPLPGTGSPLGGLVLFHDEPQPFDRAQLRSLEELASRVATEVVRARAVSPRQEARLADEEVPEGSLVGDTLLEPDLRTAGRARRLLRSLGQEWALDDDAVDTAELLLSELVTNALIHTDAPAELRVLLEDDLLTVTVRDSARAAAGGTTAEVVEHDDPMRVHGRGLQLVEALSERWGSERDAVGTTAWFALRVAP